MRSLPRSLVGSIVMVAAAACVSTAQPSTLSPSPASSTAAATQTPSPSPAVSITAPTLSPTVSPTSGSVTYENAVLGYRITFPSGYRRSVSRIISGHQPALGNDYYTRRSASDENDECQRDLGDIGPNYPERESSVSVNVLLNTGGMSAADWVATPDPAGGQPLSMHRRVEPTTIGGREAVRLVSDNVFAETMLVVVRANDRMYVISPDSWSQPSSLPKGWLDDIAGTFVAIPPAAIPSPAATMAPRAAASALADELAKAFDSRDASAIARLLPACHFAVYPLVDGQPPGGVLNRSVSSFTQGLAARFAAGDLTVAIDRSLRVSSDSGGDRYFVRSQWREPDRTTTIDLELRPGDDRWVWGSALHLYTASDLRAGDCSLNRVPWSPTTSKQGWC